MTPTDIQTIHTLLTTRVPCQNAREGVAIANLAAKLVAHFATEKQPLSHIEQPCAATHDPGMADTDKGA